MILDDAINQCDQSWVKERNRLLHEQKIATESPLGAEFRRAAENPDLSLAVFWNTLQRGVRK